MDADTEEDVIHTEEKKTIIVVHETYWKSLANDITTFVFCGAIMSLGWWMGSEAMQWFGFVAFVVQVMGMWRRMREGVTTPQKAADHLKEKFGVVAK